MRGFYFTTISSLVLVIFSSTGCNYKVIKDPLAYEKLKAKQEVKVAESELVSWNFIKTSVLNTCMDCHAGHSQPSLADLSSVQANINKVISEVHGNDMPPLSEGYAPLSDCKKAILEAWAQQGAPEKSLLKVGELAACQNTKEKSDNKDLSIEDMPLNYQTLLNKVLQPKCIRCHNPNSDDEDAAHFIFYPYTELVKKSRLWAGPGKASKIVRVVTRNDEERMPPPDKGEALTEKEVEFIIRWIDAGKPEL